MDVPLTSSMSSWRPRTVFSLCLKSKNIVQIQHWRLKTFTFPAASFLICRLTLLTFHLLFAYSCHSDCSFRVLISAWDSFAVSINVWIKRHPAICFKHTPRVKWACHVAIFPLSHILPETFALPAGTPSRSFSDRCHSEEQMPFGSDVLTG